MDEGKVEESCEADGDGEDEDGIEDKEERRVRPVDEEVYGHVLRAHFGQLVEARVEEGKDARRWTGGGCGCGCVGPTVCSHQGTAATYGSGGTNTPTTTNVLSTTHLVRGFGRFRQSFVYKFDSTVKRLRGCVMDCVFFQ